MGSSIRPLSFQDAVLSTPLGYLFLLFCLSKRLKVLPLDRLHQLSYVESWNWRLRLNKISWKARRLFGISTRVFLLCILAQFQENFLLWIGRLDLVFLSKIRKSQVYSAHKRFFKGQLAIFVLFWETQRILRFHDLCMGHRSDLLQKAEWWNFQQFHCRKL